MLAAVLLRGWRLSWRSTHYRDGSASSFVYTRRGPHTKGRFRHRFLAALAFRLASRRCPGHVRCGCGSRVRFAAARCRGYRRIIIAGDFLSAPPPDLVHSPHVSPGSRVSCRNPHSSRSTGAAAAPSGTKNILLRSGTPRRVASGDRTLFVVNPRRFPRAPRCACSPRPGAASDPDSSRHSGIRFVPP